MLGRPLARPISRPESLDDRRISRNRKNILDLEQQVDPLAQRVLVLEQLVATLVPSGAGQMRLVANSATFPDITSAAWQPINVYDATTPGVAADARNIAIDLPAGTLAPNIVGIWRMNFSFTMTHDLSASDRTLLFRVFDATESLPYGDETRILVSRDQEGTNWGLVILVEVTPAVLGHAFRIELSALGASIATVNFLEVAFGANYVDALETAQAATGEAFDSGFSEGFG